MSAYAPGITREVVENHGVTEDEYARIVEHLGRAPNLLELGIFSVLWSEHCSYKSSRVHLGGFPTTGPHVVHGPGENAGVIDIGEGLVAVFKIESHNHPSFIEPYQGATTGVGGILRDVFTMGARPLAVMDSLRFGEPGDAKTRRLVRGVVAGVGGYGNCFGVPTVGGETAFDACYNHNILVNAFALGICKREQLFLARAEGVGNPVFYVGARTGRDGIHGATMASAEFDEQTAHKRPTVQVGDPFKGKVLLEACLELFQTGVVVGIQDMGAAGLTSSSVEMASRAGTGLVLEIDQVPRRERGMTPYEVMLSESQERMLVVVQRGREDVIRGVFARHELDAVEVGAVAGDGFVTIREHGAVVARVPVRALTDDAPRYQRPMAEPEDLEDRWTIDAVPAPKDRAATLLRLLGSPNLCSKRWIWEQFDRDVRLANAGKTGGDAAVVRVPGTSIGLAISTDCNARRCWLDPYRGGLLAVAEAALNVAVTGATPLAISDCLNFGSPERPEIMWELAEAVRGIADACRSLDTPVVSGNVSLYNETGDRAVYPTPVVAMVGRLPDVTQAVPAGFRDAGDEVLLLGELRGSLGGSEYLAAIHEQVAGRPPAPDLDAQADLVRLLGAAARARLLKSAHDVADGGVAIALAECCLLGDIGAELTTLPGAELVWDARWFGEDPGVAVVSATPASAAKLTQLAGEWSVPVTRLGTVGGTRLVLEGTEVALAQLRTAFERGLDPIVG